MSAFLMDPTWARSKSTSPDSRREFFAYAGQWKLVGNIITHYIEFASVASEIGRTFVRAVIVVDDDTIELVTAEERSRSGVTYVTKLRWQRHPVCNDPGSSH